MESSRKIYFDCLFIFIPADLESLDHCMIPVSFSMFQIPVVNIKCLFFTLQQVGGAAFVLLDPTARRWVRRLNNVENALWTCSLPKCVS